MRFLLFASWLAVGCGSSGPGQGSCNSVSGSDHQCVDYQNVVDGQLGAFEDSCSVTGDSWSSGLCDHSASSGGCQQQQSTGLITIWYFGLNTAQVMSNCQADGTFDYVAP